MNPQIQNQEFMLKESIKHFLTSYHIDNSDYSSFESIFFRLIQTMLDPPLEVTWFYSAITFHAAKSSSQNSPSTRVLIAKDLLNLLISCSNLSSASKKIGLLAPVIYELYNIVCDSRKRGLSVKMEVDKLVEDMFSYVMMSAAVYDYGNGDVKSDNAVACFEDLVRVWTTDRGGGSCNFADNSRVFFPLLSDGTWKGVNVRCGVRELVVIVLCELFFLKLYLSFGSEMCTEDFLKDKQDQAVQTIKGFRNSYFIDMLLKMLLEPCLPVASLLSSEDAVILHKVLYDAVILVDYSFYSGRWAQSSDCHSKKLALLWVLVADRAIQFARAKNDQARANSYLNAFRESQLMDELIKWATIQAGVTEQNARPDITTPKALINWLFVLEDHEIQVFDHNISLAYAKAVSKVASESPLNHNILGWKKNDPNKDQEMDDMSNNGSPGALCLMNPENDVGRKRKEFSSDVQESRVKQVRLESSVRSVGNEVINISSDDDMES
ncbi:hypothetical protein DH2020_001783 [Rehmannia glutinosa]|uniref:Uncharacterized protein n=1 Tax=Rehmannia glutinosa TaxID=99300 RepID=A0ABR0XRZ2_REHGL